MAGGWQVKGGGKGSGGLGEGKGKGKNGLFSFDIDGYGDGGWSPGYKGSLWLFEESESDDNSDRGADDNDDDVLMVLDEKSENETGGVYTSPMPKVRPFGTPDGEVSAVTAKISPASNETEYAPTEAGSGIDLAQFKTTEEWFSHFRKDLEKLSPPKTQCAASYYPISTPKNPTSPIDSASEERLSLKSCFWVADDVIQGYDDAGISDEIELPIMDADEFSFQGDRGESEIHFSIFQRVHMSGRRM